MENNRAIDEIWYKRAVEYHYRSKESYVISVPLTTGDNPPTVVTVSHAIFKKRDDGQEAPAAVVGAQLDYDKFVKEFNDEFGHKVLRFLDTTGFLNL